MIDETLLTRALADAGAAYDEPAGGRDAILAAAATLRRPAESPGVRRPSWRRPMPAAAAVVGLAVAVVLAVTVPGDPTFFNGPVSRLTSASDEAASGADGGTSPDGFVTQGRTLDTSAGGGTSTGGAATAPLASVPAPQLAPGSPPQRQADQPSLAKVVKTGSVEVVVPDGKVPATLARLETLVAGARGFVADSKTQETGDSPSGVITMRVPGAAYETVLGRVRTLGEVRTATSSGEDVTAAFVDTEARLRTLRSTRAVYETLLAKARSIGEVLAVQQQINASQTQIEQLEGKLKVLKDQVSYATLTVSVFEQSDELATLEEPGRLSSAWDRAKDNFGDGLEWVIAASGTVAILTVFLAALLVLGWTARRVLRRRLV